MPDKQPENEFQRLFTLSEANGLIPQFAVWMTEMRDLHHQIGEIVHSKSEVSRGNGRAVSSMAELRRDLETVSASADRIRDLLDRIAITGAIVKDIDEGLIDFPSNRDNRTVFLCWRLGEEKIAFWHEIDTGAAGRRPL